MGYKKGEDIFPEELLIEIQKYSSGELVYIPQKKAERKAWGQCSGIKMEIVERNGNIRRQFSEGVSLQELSEQYFLAVETIKRIVYSKT